MKKATLVHLVNLVKINCYFQNLVWSKAKAGDEVFNQVFIIFWLNHYYVSRVVSEVRAQELKFKMPSVLKVVF